MSQIDTDPVGRDEAIYQGEIAEARGIPIPPELEEARIRDMLCRIGAPFDDEDVEQAFDLVWSAAFSAEEAIEECFRESAAATLGAAGADGESGDPLYAAALEACNEGDFCSCHWSNQRLADLLEHASCDPRLSQAVQDEARLQRSRLVAFGDFQASMSEETRRCLIEALRRWANDPLASPGNRSEARTQMRRQLALLMATMRRKSAPAPKA